MRVLVVGSGDTGRRIATRLLAGRNDVTVYHNSPDDARTRAAQLPGAATGARVSVATSAAEAVPASDVVILATPCEGNALLTAPEKIAGAVAMSGRLLPEVLPHAAPAGALRDKPVLVVHGARDEKLGIHLARRAREQLGHFPIALDYRELPMGHQVTPASLAEVAAWLAAALDRPAITSNRQHR